MTLRTTVGRDSAGLDGTAFTDLDHRSIGSAIAATWVAFVMVVIVPAIFISFTPHPPDHLWLGIMVIITASGLRYAWIVGDGRRRLIEMSFWVFTYVFLGLAPLVQLRLGEVPDTAPRIDHSLDGVAIVLVLAGLAAFFAGQFGSKIWQYGQKADSAGRFRRNISLRRSLILAAIALLVDLYFLNRVGPGNALASRREFAGAVFAAFPNRAIGSVIFAMATMSILVAFIALVKCWQEADAKQWPLLFAIVVVGIMLAVVLNPISNARYLAGTAALAVAALFGLFATPNRFRLVAVLAVAALVIIFPAADAFRYSSTAEFKSNSPIESLISPDYDAFAQINNTVLFVKREGVTNGQQALGVALFWVPRRIWPDKPADTGVLLADSRNYNVTNLSAPLWAELYINGGWILLVVGMGAVGFASRVADRRIELSLRRARTPTILGCILPFYLIILLRGSLLQAMPYLLVIVICALAVTRKQEVVN